MGTHGGVEGRCHGVREVFVILSAAAIYMIFGADPVSATGLGVLTAMFLRFVEMWGD